MNVLRSDKIALQHAFGADLLADRVLFALTAHLALVLVTAEVTALAVLLDCRTVFVIAYSTTAW